MSEATDEATDRQQMDANLAEAGLRGVGEYNELTGLYEWMNGGLPVGAVIGRNVRRIREERVLTQHELAQMWKRHGLSWARSKVSALEAGNRPSVSVAELILMAAALDVPLSELFAGPETGRVQLAADPDAVEVLGPDLQRLFEGGDPQEMLKLETMGRPAQLREEYMRELTSQPQAAQADVELAQRLRVENPAIENREVIQAAMDLFDGRSLTLERDRRVERMGALTMAERQAHRGHITRELSALVEAKIAKDRGGQER